MTHQSIQIPAVSEIEFFGTKIPEAIALFINESPDPLGAEYVKIAKSNAKKHNSSVAAELYNAQCVRNQKAASALNQGYEDSLRKLGYSRVAVLRTDQTSIRADIASAQLPMQVIIGAFQQARAITQQLMEKAEADKAAEATSQSSTNPSADEPQANA